ncbi:hypothetical protein MY5147_007406 [Beauveria neobassiana]
MDEEERFSASSPESERENEHDEVMEDEPAEPDQDDNNEDNNDEDDDDGDQDDGHNASAQNNGSQEPLPKKSSSPRPQFPAYLRPTVRPEYVTARLYDIVPTMAAPQSTSVNAMAITPDLRYWFTGGSDGYIRKYDGPGTINGKLALTVAQRHPFVDSVTKAGILMSYWENEEPPPPGAMTSHHEQILSPVYSLAVESTALWLLSGLESGAINLQSVRHDEGKKICSLQRHTNAVSVLTMAPDETTVLSGSWDKTILDWDLNTGQVIRSFTGTAGQISAVELRPERGDPVPADADDPPPHTTMTTNSGAPFTNGFASTTTTTTTTATNGVHSHQEETHGNSNGVAGGEQGEAGGASPAHESLFGGSDAGSLFGETAGDDEQPFGKDDDVEYAGGMGMMTEQEGGMDHSADMAMAGLDVDKDKDKPADDAAPAVKEEAAAAPESDAMDVDDPQPVKHEAPLSQDSSAPQPTDVSATQSTQTMQTNSSQSGTEPFPPAPLPPLPPAPRSPTLVTDTAAGKQLDSSQTSATTFLASAMDGTIRIWDRRMPNPAARIVPRAGVPPWCMSACWSPDGNKIYAGRRNGTVEEYDVRAARSGWAPERVLKFPADSGAVSAVKPMANGRHLVCASFDIMRLYDLHEQRAHKHSTVPFLIIPGPPRAGVISSLYIDPTSRFMLSAAGTRGWNGTSTEVLVGYEISVTDG